MRAGDLVGMAFSALRRRKLRALLTMLAVVIGATLIGLMISLTSGIQTFIVDQFGIFVPEESIFVTVGERSLFGGQGGTPREITAEGQSLPRPFTADDVSRIRAVSGVVQIDPVQMVSALDIHPAGSEKKYTVSVSTGPEYQLRLRKLVTGRYFAPDATGQCLIPFEYVGLFEWPSAEEALGREVVLTIGRINPFNPETREFTFSVVGVLENTLNASEVLVPTADAAEMARFYRDDPEIYTEEQPGLVLLVKAADRERVDEVAGALRDLGYSVTTPDDILARINSVFSIIQIALVGFGVIALVVAAIGIINTLLMAVYERTREIGIMKAVGASRGAVRALFTMEGIMIGFAGGMVGVGVAWVLGQLLNVIGSRTFLSDYPTFTLAVFPLWLLAGIVALTTIISLVAAIYPANRAAGLDPVQALGYE